MTVECKHKHPSDLARAVWRFTAEVPVGYHGDYPDAPLRGTRPEAEADACKALHDGIAQ